MTVLLFLLFVVCLCAASVLGVFWYLMWQHSRKVAEENAKLLLQAEEATRQWKALVEREPAAAKRREEERSALLAEAQRQAELLVQEANERVQKITGEAYAVLRSRELHQRQITAIKNTIKGYGDAYLVPSHSVLDDLAEELRHLP